MVSPRPLSVLIVDNHRDAADSLTELLCRLGHNARAAHGGVEALAQAMAHPPDLAIIELLMPVMSGFEVARELRAGKRPPLLVALSESDGEDIRRLAGEAGFHVYLLKPADPDSLDAILEAARAGQNRTGRATNK